MKNKIFTSLAVIGVALLFYFSVSAFTGNEKKLKNASEIQSNTRDTFTNCIFNTSYRELIKWGLVSQLHVTSNLNRFNDLNFNAVHSYDDGLGSAYYGEVNTPTLSLGQIANYQDFLDSVKDEGNLYGFFERSFLSYYCYGQRLIYEVAQDTNNKTLNFGFVYQKREIGNYEMDGNRTVIHAVPAADSMGGYLCKDIYENIQHSDLFCFRQNDKGKWFIKPVMRIPDSMPPSKKVVRIDIISFNGTPVDSIIITADNFYDDNGSYSGNYLEKYFRLLNPLQILGDTNSKHLNYGKGSEDDWQDWEINCKVDFRVYWYGKCEVWFDKMIVDDEVGNDLFDSVKQIAIINPRIQQEVQSFSNQGGLYTFFTDEVFISQYPCIKYVVDKMRENTFYHPRFSLALTRGGNMYGMKVDSNGFRVLLDSIKPDFVQDDHHGFQSYLQKLPATITISDSKVPTNNDWIANSNSDYNQVLQHNTLGCKTDAQVNNSPGSLLSELVSVKSSVSSYLPTAKFIMQPQIHGWLWYNDDAGKYTGGSREPTNEEIQVQAMLSIAHGADGLCWFIYNSRIDSNLTTHKPVFYTIGMLDPEDGYSNRVSNCYGQNKWQYVSQMNAKINKWMDVLDNAEWAGGYSVHSDGANWEYINDIRSKAPYINGLNPCADYGGTSEYFDCTAERYWEQGFFNPKDQSDKSKYFIMVNRRCVPPTQSAVGEVRTLRIKFNTLPDFNNWVLRDVYTNKQITFDKNNIGQGGYLNLGEDTSDLGYFKPGEGKLFQLIPVSAIGGTLAGDETLSGNINCNGKIYNGGHNITISPNTTVTFSDSAGIEMNGGCFVSGVNADNADDVTLTGKTGTTFWKGITLIGCDSIGVYNTNISNIKANDTAKAFSIINSYKVNFRKNTINANSNSGGIQAVYNTFSDNPIVFNVRECNFNMNYSGYSAISIFSNASVTLPIVTEWCMFNSQNDTSNAILFTEVTGGAIKNNTFTNFGKSVVLMYSTTDFYGNTILGKNNSQGILCLSGSYASLSPTSGQYLGGYNYIKNYGTSAGNVYSNNSYFNINNGQNDFDLSDIDNSKHLTGDLSGIPYSYVNATKNCFHKDSITNIEATHSVIWNSSSDPVNFVFTDYSCELTPPGDYFVYQYGGYNDTVYYSSGGVGGGFNPNKPMNIEENVYKSLKDSININLRKRNYLTVENKSKQLLTQYPDSLESATMVQKLYMASLSLDSTKIGITKSFLENLIATNTQNPTLIKRAFYFIQKCKVKLGQYQSALDGFQYIMTQNPYTYEGLVASWDYAATYLLMGAGGSYKGENEEQTEELNTPADTLLSRMTKSDINTNKSKNTNSNKNSTEQITKTLYEKIKNVTKDDKTAQEEKVKTLEKKNETTKSKNEKNEAITELATMKQIKEVVKLKKPNTIVTHTAIINNDIKKVFGIGKSTKSENTNNLIPTTYTLYQNYPNPFNPTTKIAFDMPRDAKVKLVIYDILGREMKTLVNNEYRSAGKYITEFNGSNLASGIYFARILVNEGNDFMAVKKMVLLK